MKFATLSFTASICLLLVSACVDEHESLMKELQSASPVKRAGAVKSLAKLGDDEAYMLVSRSLDDSSVVVRIAAVQALGVFAKRDTTAAISRASLDNDPEVRLAVVKELTKRGDQTSRELLLKMLIRGETDRSVRKELIQSLKKMGWEGERLAGEMSESLLASDRDKFSKGTMIERVRAIKQAARSINPGGIDLVLDGLNDKDPDVVIAAVRSLDGRGGSRALRALQLLIVNGHKGVRSAVVHALGKYGKPGLEILSDALRDTDPDIRLHAIETFKKNKGTPDERIVCRLLFDEEKAVAMAAASMLTNPKKCDLSKLFQGLIGKDVHVAKDSLDVLSKVGGAGATKAIEVALESGCTLDKLTLHLALVRRAGNAKKSLRYFKREFDKLFDEITKYQVSWIKNKLPPLIVADESDEAKGRLSEEKLKALYKAHGLGPVRPNSPRGISDLLAGHGEEEKDTSNVKLILPVSDEQLDKLAMALEGLIRTDKKEGISAVHKIMALASTRFFMMVARVLDECREAVALNDDELKIMERVLDEADSSQAEILVKWLVRTKDRRVVPVLLSAIKKSKWKKNIVIIDGLGTLRDKAAVGKLVEMLEGYSSISAAQALAKIGDKSAIDGLKKALKYAGPAEEMVFMYVLAQLGYNDVLSMVEPDLDDPNPEVRRNAVVILGELGGQKAVQAVKKLRYDLDRFVRKETQRVIEEQDATGVKSDVRQEKTVEGRSSDPAP